MEPGFIDLTAENIADQHLCCIIRSKKPHPGVEAKRRWLVDRLPEGHVFRKLDVKEKVFIEYAPLETAWVPVEGDNYLYLYCLWVAGAYKGKGYGRALIEYVMEQYRGKGHTMLVGTGDSPLTVPFYQRCGFTEHHRVKNFFLDNYDHPIVECGVTLRDMVYLSRPL